MTIALLMPVGALADTISYSNSGPRQGSLGSHNRTAQSKKNGKYRLVAFADDSNVPGVDNKDSGLLPYLAGNNSNSRGIATQTGVKWDAKAEAVIDYTNQAWSSVRSRAAVIDLKQANPGETAQARATVTDPWFWEPIDFDEVVTFEVLFFPGIEIAARADPGDTASASLMSNASTDLNGIGTLWNFSWFTDSSTPGFSTVEFVSNPILGLNDAAIMSGFISQVIGDPSTGVSTLAAPFSFSYQLTILANTTPEFTGNSVNEAQAATVPEPSTVLILSTGLICLRGYGWRRKNQAV